MDKLKLLWYYCYMADLERAPREATEIDFTPSLRDRALQFMPAHLLELGQPVSVTYYPPDTEPTKLTMEYIPRAKVLAMDVFETLRQEAQESDTSGTLDIDTYRRFIHRRTLEIDITTGAILSYMERGEARDQDDVLVEPPEEEATERMAAYISYAEPDESAAELASHEELIAINEELSIILDPEKLAYLMGLFDRL